MSDATNAILTIYDAAIDDNKWQTAIEDSLALIEAPSATIHVVDLSDENPWVINYRGGTLSKWTPDDMEFYTKNLAKYEASGWEYLQRSSIRTAIEDKEIWPDIESVRMRADYKYLEDRFGLFRRIVARLNDNSRWFDAIALQFDASTTEIPSQVKTRTEMLLPHIAKAIEMSRTYRELLRRYHAVLSALDHVQMGMCLALSSGEVIVSNQAALAIFDARAGVWLDSRAHLVCKDPAAHDQLRHAIFAASVTARGEGNSAEHIQAIARRGDLDALLIEVSPIRDSLVEIDRNLHGAIITLIDPSVPRPFDSERVAKVYGFTKAETEVSRMVVDGWSNPDIADERGVSIETVKTQVVSVLRKTKTSGRAELIRLVLKTCPPVRNKQGEAGV